MSIPYCLSYCSFKINLEIASISLPTLLFFKIILAILGPLYFQKNIRIILWFLNTHTLTHIHTPCRHTHKSHEDFEWNCSKPIDYFKELTSLQYWNFQSLNMLVISLSLFISLIFLNYVFWFPMDRSCKTFDLFLNIWQVWWHCKP